MFMSRFIAKICFLTSCVAFTILFGLPLLSQSVDYTRADLIRTYDPLLVGGRVYPTWLVDGVRFYYTEYGVGPDRGVPYLVDPSKGTKVPLFDSDKVAKSLTKLGESKLDPEKLPKWRLLDDEEHVQFIIDGHFDWCSVKTSQCAKTKPALTGAPPHRPPAWATRSPDNQWDAFIWDNNVYIRPGTVSDAAPDADEQAFPSSVPKVRPGIRLESWCDEPVPAGVPSAPDPQPLPQGSIALTDDGSSLWTYADRLRGGLEPKEIDFDRYQRSRGKVIWSPDSRKLVVQRQDLRGLRIYPLYSSTSNQPVDHSYFYASPGDEKIPQLDWYIIDISAKSVVKVQVPATGLILTSSGAYWGANSEELFVVSSDRGPKTITLSAVNTTTGLARPIIQEHSDTYVELQNDSDGINLEITKDGTDIIWFSERDGWGHLYRYSKNGDLKNQVESGPYSVAYLTHVDAAKQNIYFTAWGKVPGIPYYAHFYRVNFDGSGMTLLSPEPGNHTIQFAPKSDYFIDTFSSIEKEPTTVLRRADGSLVMELSKGNVEELRKTGWTPAETFTVKARDGATDLFGIMYKPSFFDPAKRYPVITNIYPGPFAGSVGAWVFKGPDWYAAQREETLFQERNALRWTHGEGMGRSLAELGFIIIELDAMGTSHRSKAFQDYFYGHVSDNGLPDQITAIRQLAARYPWMDVNRVGVFGHSGGGYAAGAAMLHYPDFFKVGVSESGNHDFRIYGWYWGEMYQGLYQKTGVTDNYELEADYKYAANLKGKLLLIHGDMDCNNPPAETLRLVDALIKADKDFDMLLVPDAGHQLPDYVIKQAWNYFVRNLLNAEPAKEYHMIP